MVNWLWFELDNELAWHGDEGSQCAYIFPLECIASVSGETNTHLVRCRKARFQETIFPTAG